MATLKENTTSVDCQIIKYSCKVSQPIRIICNPNNKELCAKRIICSPNLAGIYITLHKNRIIGSIFPERCILLNSNNFNFCARTLRPKPTP